MDNIREGSIRTGVHCQESEDLKNENMLVEYDGKTGGCARPKDVPSKGTTCVKHKGLGDSGETQPVQGNEGRSAWLKYVCELAQEAGGAHRG